MWMVNKSPDKYRPDGVRSFTLGMRSELKRWGRTCIAYVRLGDRVTVRDITLDVTGVPIGRQMATRLYYGDYETVEAHAIETYLKPGMDLVDIGACLGFTSCFSEQRLAPDDTVVALEPNPLVHDALARTRELNGSRFEIVRAAYDPTADAVELVQSESAWSASVYRSGGEPLRADTITLEEVIGRYDLTNLAVLVDIEGGEAGLIEHELDVLEDRCDLLIIEFHDGYEYIGRAQRDRITDARKTLHASAFESVQDHANVSVFVT